MQALDYNAGDFAAYLATPQKFNLDLSDATVNEVIDAIIGYQKILNPKAHKQYSSLRKQMASIEQSFGVEIMPSQITDVFWSHFISWQVNVGKLALSTIKTNCGKLRSALSWASRHNCRVSPTFDFVKLPPYSHDAIALTPDEVSHIYHFDIGTIERRKQYRRTLERVRDMFVLSCNLGQRYSDMSRIDHSCFERNVFRIVQQKTGNVSRVDIDRMSLDRNTTYAILDKYGKTAPYPVDNTAYNHRIKWLLQHIGCEFNVPVKVEYKVNGLIEHKVVPKWKMITSHTARRTFITCNILRGFSEAEIRRASGHKTASAMDKYICYSDR